jgi:circadian clock protein KaiB
MSTELSPRYVLRLYVTGKTPNSLRAIANLKEVCEEYLPGQYDLQVIDIYQQPELAEGDRIMVVPTLIKKLPAPLRRLIGDLSDRERMMIRLDLLPDPEA